jgi:hypothetical protein
MEIQLRKLRLVPLFAVVLIFSLASLACEIGGISFGQNGATIEVTLTEGQVNTLFNNVESFGASDANRLLDKISGVEMHNGYIRMLGTTTNSNGQEVSGSFDVSVAADNDVLVAQIISVNIPGVDMTDPRIVNANEELSRELSKSVTDTNGDVAFKEATVTENELKIVVQVKLK